MSKLSGGSVAQRLNAGHQCSKDRASWIRDFSWVLFLVPSKKCGTCLQGRVDCRDRALKHFLSLSPTSRVCAHPVRRHQRLTLRTATIIFLPFIISAIQSFKKKSGLLRGTGVLKRSHSCTQVNFGSRIACLGICVSKAGTGQVVTQLFPQFDF